MVRWDDGGGWQWDPASCRACLKERLEGLPEVLNLCSAPCFVKPGSCGALSPLLTH